MIPNDFRKSMKGRFGNNGTLYENRTANLIPVKKSHIKYCDDLPLYYISKNG